MNRFILVLGSALLAMLTTTAQAAVSLSVGIHEPGFYGRIGISDFPAPPPVIRPAPVVVVPGPPMVATRAPIYLHVPPYEIERWPQYCGRYSACNQPVYFVQENWYREVYVPRYYYPVRGRGPDRWDYREYRRGEGYERHHRHDRDGWHGR